MRIIYGCHSLNIRNPHETSHAIEVASVTDDYGFILYLQMKSDAFKAANVFLFPGRYPHLEQ